MSDETVDPKLITAELLADHLRELSKLEEEYELAKHALAGGDFPVSDKEFEEWYDSWETTEKELDIGPAFERYNKASNDFHCKCNYLEEAVPFFCVRHSLELVADRFPSLRGIEGVFEMDFRALEEWIEEEACPQGIHAARFMMSLWSNNQSLFKLDEAFAVWDREHQEAYVHWLKRPVMPLGCMWGDYLKYDTA